MLIVSLVWVALAAAAILIATLRTFADSRPDGCAAPVKESGKALAVLAALYGLALLAGFLCVSNYLVSSL